MQLVHAQLLSDTVPLSVHAASAALHSSLTKTPSQSKTHLSVRRKIEDLAMQPLSCLPARILEIEQWHHVMRRND